MMLEHLGEAPAAAQLMRAVEMVTSRGDVLTPDLGGKATTDQVTEAIINAIRGVNL
jgi:tartrate dehydrogenase/decarboxylase/D-malate dehydrogenase